MGSGSLLGVVGGMGTAAGLLFLDSLMQTCRSHGAAKDQDYPEWIYYNASEAPDRTAAILGGGMSPVPYLTSVMRRMAAAGGHSGLGSGTVTDADGRTWVALP